MTELRRRHQPEAIKGACIWIVQCEVWEKNLKLTIEDFERMCNEDWVKEKAIRDLNEMDLTDKLVEENLVYPYKTAKRIASSMMSKFPEELIPNLEEWLDGKPLSDIRLGGKSVNDIVHMYEGVEIDVPRAILCLGMWKERNYSPSDFCEWYFARL